MSEPIEKRADLFFRELQSHICDALAREDGRATFGADRWERGADDGEGAEGGGGGLTRVLTDGARFEKAGVNTSSVHGELRPGFAAHMPGDGTRFFAAGISLVLHPQSPRVPTVHANFRCIRRGSAFWFGGGADLTPYYPVAEDVVHFHATWKRACDRHDAEFYPRFKKWCDEYFYLAHRKETRGVGGIFFDWLQRDPERDFAFVKEAGAALLDAYLPIVRRRREDAWGERERAFHRVRRGRYVEFNLVYDRGTTFGLKTGGRVESILMSLPPVAEWPYDPRWPDGSEEARLVEWLQPRDWLGGDLPGPAAPAGANAGERA
jgi:coproporphyrinogen III oxidase